MTDWEEKPFYIKERYTNRTVSAGWRGFRRRRVHLGWSYYSYGRCLFTLTPSEGQMNIRRFTTFSFGEPLEYSCTVECCNYKLLNKVLPWVRERTKTSGGKWSVHNVPDWERHVGRDKHNRLHLDSSYIPMVFSFSNGEDGVLFRLFYEEIIALAA